MEESRSENVLGSRSERFVLVIFRQSNPQGHGECPCVGPCVEQMEPVRLAASQRISANSLKNGSLMSETGVGSPQGSCTLSAVVA